MAYLNATYKDYCSAGLIGTGLDSDPALLTNNGVFDCYDVSGNDVESQPSLSGSLSPTYETDIGNGMSLSIRGDIRYEGAQYLDQANVAEMDAVTTANLSFGLRADKWDAALYINNITDEDEPLRWASAQDQSITETNPLLVGGPNSQQNYVVTPRAPRTIGLRAGYRF